MPPGGAVTAQPVEPMPLGAVERTPEAVRAALPPEQRARFDAAWRAAVDEARSTPSLVGLQKVVGDFWAIACALRAPRSPQADTEERRWLAGEAHGIPAEELFAELGLNADSMR
jgi:hypothetical protein